MDRFPLYSQFDGQTIGSRRYGLNDEIDQDEAGPGIVAILKEQGRISASKTVETIIVPPSDQPLVTMSRPELEATALATIDLSSYSDDELRRRIEEHRERKTDESKEGAALASDAGADFGGDDVYADLKDKPLDRLTMAQLGTVATAEGVTFGDDVKTKSDRMRAIQAKRDDAAPPAA